MNAWDPFDRPRPTLDCLMHESVLVQAWKKSHAYIRSRNWYADALELDHSAAELPELILSWQKDYQKYGVESLRPAPMRIVPAPKGWSWRFDADQRPEWHPKPGTEKKPHRLRPLAHLDIRSQTFFTALMICVADAVETSQGRPRVSSTHVSSYGNRLFCDWGGKEKQTANFRWANATSYRKYFMDYRAFLERPKCVCRNLATEAFGRGVNSHPGVVVLDLSGFYDHIRPYDVMRETRDVCERYENNWDNGFVEAALMITDFRWSEPDQRLYGNASHFGAEKGLPNGLPQGGVASGFFSNVAMLRFDEAINKLIGSGWKLPGGISVRDYVRYVDDMRLVVEHDDNADTVQVGITVAEEVEGLLKKLAHGQSINIGKTSYLALEDIETRGSDAVVMESLANDMSGPMDRDALQETSRSLEGLLNSLDDLTLINGNETSVTSNSLCSLARLHRKVREVRDDTIVRFAAYRQFVSFRERRRLIDNHDDVEALRLEAEIDLAMRRLVHLWAHDPSLAVILRFAFELHPNIEVLMAIRESALPYLRTTSDSSVTEQGRLSVWYVFADLLRSLASRPEASKKSEDSFFEYAADMALGFLRDYETPWYVQQQAAIYLLACGKGNAVLDATSPARANSDELSRHRGVARLMDARPEESVNSKTRVNTAALAVALQLTLPKQRAALLDKWAGRDAPPRNQIVRGNILRMMPELGPRPKRYSRPLSTDKPIRLSILLKREPNPFGDEVATLRLLRCFLGLKIVRNNLIDQISVDQIMVICDNWEDLSNATISPRTVGLEIEIKPIKKVKANRLAPESLPDWAVGKRRWQMAAGMVARCAFMGTHDPTQFWRPELEPATGYRGIRSGWYKRRYGMFHRPDGLGGPFAACSSWFSELLAKLLAWPGGSVRDDLIWDWEEVQTADVLVVLIDEQLKRLKEQYASATAMPVYVHRIAKQPENPTKLRVVMIQTVRPWDDDLKNDIVLADPGLRSRQRNHLSAMLRLAESHLLAKKTYEKSNTASNIPRRADLTLLPEISVHIDDLDLVERYVDRTHSAVFCGLVIYSKRFGCKTRLINEGRWIIRDDAMSGRSLRHIAQGKKHMTPEESQAGVHGFRPYQAVLAFVDNVSGLPLYRITGNICFDATDLALVGDLRSVSDLYAVLANNRDITTFDTMAAAYKFHMHQHVAIVNSGEYGGSLIHAPFREDYQRILTHHHGGENAAVSVVDIDLTIYRQNKTNVLKGWPAGFTGR